MAVSVFDPATDAFQNVIVPTTAGADRAVQPGRPVGGADVSALVPVALRGGVAFLSLLAYQGWDTQAVGEYPTFGYIGTSPGGGHAYQAASGRTAADIAASNPGVGACDSQWSDGPPLADCRGPASMAALPVSGDLAVAQYFDNTGAGRDSGGLMVLDSGGRLINSYTYPNITASGTTLQVLPREIDADPTSPPGHERFAVVFDVFGPGANGPVTMQPFALQVFQFDSASGAITPLSNPVLPGQTVGGRQAYFETAHFDRQGDLWAAESVVGSISGGNVIEYSHGSVVGRLTSGACAASPGWATSGWGTTCTPDVTLSAAAGAGFVRSVTEDPVTGTIFFATSSGYLVPVVPPAGPSQSWTTGRLVDLGLNSLVDRNQRQIGFRPGMIDPVTGVLWMPVQQLESAATCAPQAVPCQPPPRALDQWLIAVDVRHLST
jgi:hypothetical protein